MGAKVRTMECQGPKGTILVIDDCSMTIAIVQNILEKDGYGVVVATTGEEALGRCRQSMPDLIILDVCMPDMDGYETCRCLKAEGTIKEIPVIFMTSLTSAESKVAGFEAGAADYVTKPIEVQELLARIRAHLTLRKIHRQLEAQNRQLHQEIVERKKTECALRATARDLKRSNAELEQFAYVASHDLQEPLRKVASYLELLAERYRERLDRDACDFIDYAVGGAKQMKIMINNFLLYSRVETRGKPFVPADMMKVMHDVLDDLDPAIRESQAVVTYDSLPVVSADEGQLQQLLRNLIDNAIKYRSQDPPQIHVAVQRRNGDWRFCIQDNGIGIEPRFFERIFRIFQRLHGPSRYNGSGIGLAVCKKIVERHGGSMGVASTPGQGSQFYFTLPDHNEGVNHG